MPRIVFNEVAIRATKHWREGNRRRTQSRKFYQTLNPWNKNAAGQPKSRDEIMAELVAERDAWLLEQPAPKEPTHG